MKKVFITMIKELGGGAATLTMRMAKWAMSKEFTVNVFTDRVENQHLMDEMVQDGMTVYVTDYLMYAQIFDTIHEDDATYIIITHTLVEYAQAEKIKSKHSNVEKTILYVIHPYTLFYGIPGKRSKQLILALSKFFLRGYVRRIYEEGHILFMDEECIQMSQEFLGLEFKDAHNEICRLPMNVNEYTDIEIKSRKKNKPFVILTITRFELEMKGYVIGLIKSYKNLMQKYNDIRLIIIGDGNGSDEIKALVNSLNTECQDSIELIPLLPYKELDRFFQKADLYIGMGTTLLDAVNHLIPSITIHAYTFDLIATGFFHVHPNILSTSEHKIDACDLIEDVITMNDQEYIDLIAIQYHAYQELYDINNVMPKILGRKISRDNRYKDLGYKFMAVVFIKVRDKVSRLKWRILSLI
ncbi:MAG: glycosyltransferase family 4 protein [Peptococcaceae bacterium]|nr:glycosyltransferase family 4 protein [Peptococcaceae bacterium]